MAAPHLGEFDAVVFDQRPNAITEGLENLKPGYAMPVAPRVFEEMRLRLGERSVELTRFLHAGGLLVVRLRPTSGVTAASTGIFASSHDRESLNFSEWWMTAVGPLWGLQQAEIGVILRAEGSRIRVDEPGHAFEAYLRRATYAATLEPMAFRDSGLVRLASNPVGDPVGAEFSVGEGAIVLLPADGERELLEEGIYASVTLRQARRDIWPLPEEQDLLGRLDAAEAALVAEREAVIKSLAEIRAVKQQVLGDPDLQRILERFTKATRPSTPPPAALGHLHAAVEIMEERLGGERALIETLGVQKAMVKAVKQPANDRAFASRHIGTGDERAVPSETLAEALSAATTVIAAFFSYLFRSALLRAGGGAVAINDD